MKSKAKCCWVLLRTKMILDVDLLGDSISGVKVAGLPEHQTIIQITVSYLLSGVSHGDFYVDINYYLDKHMQIKGVDLPRFSHVKVKEPDRAERIFMLKTLDDLVDKTTGCLKLPQVKVVNAFEQNPTIVTIERYEIVNIPGLYTIIMPEMVVPSAIDELDGTTGPTIIIQFNDKSSFFQNHDVCVETWFNSKNHRFEKDKTGSKWVFKGVMLPGQGLSLVFKTT